jgi:arylsulfatase
MTDDMGWSDVGCYGGEIPTPNIDGLASGGVRLAQFYNTARCSPSRASLLTGLHPHVTGIGELTTADGPGGYPGSINDRCATIAESLKASGYRTHMTGKWHLCSDADRPNGSWPTRRGFDRYWGTISGAGSYFAPSTLHDGEKPVTELPEDFYYTDAIGEHAAAAIRDDAASGEPFFGYVAFTAAHWPLHARAADIAEFTGCYDEGWDVLRARRHERQVAAGLCSPDATVHERDPGVMSWEDTGDKAWESSRMEVYAAQVAAMDRAVGTIVDALEEAGVKDNTIIIYLHDNGGCAEELMPANYARFQKRQRHSIPRSAPDGSPFRFGNDPSIAPGTADTYCSYGRAWANLSNTPFRMYKRWVHEGGIATPLIVNWPDGDLEQNGLVHQPHQLTDVAPTIYDALGVEPLRVRNGIPLPDLPGVSMLPALRGDQPTSHPLFWEHIGNAAIRDNNWKLVREHDGDWELYDLATDRSEQHNLATHHPDTVTTMTTTWQHWADENDVLPRKQVLEAQARADTRTD